MLSKIPAESPRMPLEPVRPEEGREDSAYNARMTDRNAEYEQRMAEWHQSLDSSVAGMESEFEVFERIMKECSKFKSIEDEFEMRLKNT